MAERGDYHDDGSRVLPVSRLTTTIGSRWSRRPVSVTGQQYSRTEQWATKAPLAQFSQAVNALQSHLPSRDLRRRCDCVNVVSDNSRDFDAVVKTRSSA